MGLFKRGKKDKGKSGGDSRDATPTDPAEAETAESSPQKVGVVSGVLSTTAETGEGERSLFGDVVSRRFGPNDDEGDGVTRPPRPEAESMNEDTPPEDEQREAPGEPASRDHLRAVEPLFPDHPATPDLEVDPMAHIGRATTITGNIVADEDLEIQGVVEGSVRLANHQVTIGAEGHVKASVDAETVMVYGRITGDVIASDLVEIEKGGIVGGDIRAPRIVMHDGAIVVGALDMSAALPNGGANFEAPDAPEPAESLRPVVSWVKPVEESDDVDDPGSSSDD
ncbi:MAG: polymer-forming cytoskeletal protein [bacterium]|nr:polymer-forming cytoskeletal protein [bacterium]